MPQNKITLGADINVTVRDTDKIIIQNSQVKSFNTAMSDNTQMIKTLEATHPVTTNGDITGTITTLRDTGIEKYFETKRLLISQGLPVPIVMIQTLLKEPDGTVRKRIYSNVTLTMTSLGDYTQESVPELTINYSATTISTN